MTKQQIDMLHRNKCKTASQIKNALRERVDRYEPKDKQEDEDVENDLFIPGLEIHILFFKLIII